ncbi:MAG: flagellar basal body L-ring protein FlgH [Bacteriovoracales bacterium]|nr:flagellar basal body L-ring protein FlgH [Bacteriovoracales bacterium]
MPRREKNRVHNKKLEGPFDYLKRESSFDVGMSRGLSGKKSTRKFYNKKRKKIHDLHDNSNEASLWSGEGKENYLFLRNTSRKRGDIVIIAIGPKLKEEIDLRLSKSFRRTNIKKAKRKKVALNENRSLKKGSENNNTNVDEKISTVIVDEIGKDHLLLRGRKQIPYKRGDGLIEIQALIARKDLGNMSAIHSNKILESKILSLGEK